MYLLIADESGTHGSSHALCLDEAYRRIATFKPYDQNLPVALFGVVLDRNFHSSWSVIERERFAYEVMLNRFDVMLKRLRSAGTSLNRGLVIHDRRVVAERDVQEWTREWQKAAGTIGQLRNMADVPLFADSRASRLIQAADLVSYALYRHYDPARQNADYIETLWDRFDTAAGTIHGCVHYTPSFGAGSCQCKPCQGRLLTEATKTLATGTRV